MNASRVIIVKRSMFQVRIRESNFHSSLIQGPQNFDTTIQSGGVVGGDGAATKSSQNHPKLKKPPQRAAVNPSSNSDSTSQSDSKMPVEQLTSHVLSSASKNTRFDYLNHLAVNLIILLIVKFYQSFIILNKTNKKVS